MHGLNSTTRYSQYCDFIGWNEVASEFTCVLDADYYEISFSVQVGEQISLLSITLSEENFYASDIIGEDTTMFMYPCYSGTFSSVFWGFSTYLANDLGFMAGVIIYDENGSVVFYKNRHEIAEMVVENESFDLTFDLEEALLHGEYVMRIIHECHVDWPDDFFEYQAHLDFFENDFSFNNYVGYLATNNSFGVCSSYEDGPEVIVESVSLLYEFSQFDWEVDLFHQCDSSAFIIEAPCNEELSYFWEKQIGQWWLPADGGENCQLIIPDNTLSSANSPHSYRVTCFAPDGDTLMSQTIEVLIHENPYWSYTHTGIETEGLEGACPLFFEVLIEADAGQLQNTNYTWQPDENYAELTLFSEGGGDNLEGPAIYFCFNPFNANDTIGAFYVEATNNYGIAGFEGCTTLDTTYVVYTGDSIVFKSNIFDTNLVSIQEPVPGEIKVFPNPTNSRITIEHDFVGVVRFEILDLSGRMVRQTQTTGRLEMDVSDLPQGIYITVIGDGENRVVNRLVKF